MTAVVAAAIEPRVIPAGIEDACGVDLKTVTASDSVRWRQWKAAGRADDLKFRRRLTAVVLDGAAVIALGGAIWFTFQS